ncbi:MAG TPA: hypothetical protein PLK91_07455, partial [Sphaerochaeta sp.]|nr:hypothetical protein [Sphaerochaeta sp.]
MKRFSRTILTAMLVALLAFSLVGCKTTIKEGEIPPAPYFEPAPVTEEALPVVEPVLAPAPAVVEPAPEPAPAVVEPVVIPAPV